MLPCLAAIVIKDGKIVAEGVCGVREAGGTEAATLEDVFHLGTETMTMTATLMAVLVEEGKLRWDTTVGEALGETCRDMDAGWKTVTLQQLLLHKGGSPADLDSLGLLRSILMRRTASGQRLEYLESVLKHAPKIPANQSGYSVVGYAIAGSMAEKAAGRPWEELMQEKVFRPLRITSAGFGSTGKNPLQGHEENGTPSNTWIALDRLQAIGPATTVHMTLHDWAKLTIGHLRGDVANPRRACTLIRPESYDRLHTPVGRDAMGWFVSEQDWAKGSGYGSRGIVLMHPGFNTVWYCCEWLAPERDYAVLVATNQGGRLAQSAPNELAEALGKKFLK
jgi:CubicO group peptidase (beta-lactamase class C family)